MCGAGQSLWIVLLWWVQGSMYIMQCAIKHSTCSRKPLSKLHFELFVPFRPFASDCPPGYHPSTINSPMHIPIYPAQLEALQRHVQAAEAHTDDAKHPLVAISTITKKVLSSIQRRSNSGTNINLIIGLVVGFTLAALVVGVCIFLCCYGDSIKIYKKKQRHRRRSSSSRGSRHSKQSKEVEHTEAAPEGERGEAWYLGSSLYAVLGQL